MKRRMVGGSGLLEQTHHYRLEDVFDKEDLYWKDDVGAGRLLSTLDAGVLYPLLICD